MEDEKLDWDEPDFNCDVGFCFYEDSLNTVKRAIESVKDHFRLIFAIDGKFSFLESNEELSSPEVREYLNSIDNVVLLDAPNLTEAQKRQCYLDQCKLHQTDVLFILDSDEWVSNRTKWPETEKFFQHICAKHHTPTIYGVNTQFPGKEGRMPRVWVRPQSIEYTECHNFWRFSSGEIWKSTGNAKIFPDFYMRGNDKFRNPEMLEKTFQYQKKLMAYEKPFKKNYRLEARG